MPVATGGGQGTIAVPEVDTHVSNQVRRVLDLLISGESGPLDVLVERWQLMVGEVRHPEEAVSRVRPIQERSEASDPSIADFDCVIIRLILLSVWQCLDSGVASGPVALGFGNFRLFRFRHVGHVHVVFLAVVSKLRLSR